MPGNRDTVVHVHSLLHEWEAETGECPGISKVRSPGLLVQYQMALSSQGGSQVLETT